MALKSYHNIEDIPKQDAQVMASICCTGAEVNWQPVKDFSETLREDVVKYRERVKKLEESLKSSGESVRALRKVNVALSEEVNTIRHVCVALDEQCRAANMRANFKDDIIREMRRQLKQAKAKHSRSWRAASSTPDTSFEQSRAGNSTNVSVVEMPLPSTIKIDDSSENHASNNCPSTSESILVSPKNYGPEVSDCLKKDLQMVDSQNLSFYTAHSDVSYSQKSGKHDKKYKSCVGLDLESIGRTSGSGSASGECDVTRAEYYRSKMLATMQILQNKEETVRIQAESLAVAEARIASLTARGGEMRNEIDRKTRELSTLRKLIESTRINKTDVSIQEIEEQKNIIKTLQSNLSVIEDLYRECFYESAKQEGLIEMLRTSYLDVRLMDKEKSAQIGKLQNMINTQQWSIVQCQDVAAEVENLKMEISNFLNNSNNDSGMWERSSDSISPGVGEDLHDIMDQLLRLRELLTGDCTCGFQEENMRLRHNNETLETQIRELQDRVTELESTLLDKENLDAELQQEIDRKEEELNTIKLKLAAVEDGSRCHSVSCDTLSRQLQQTEVLLNDKREELTKLQQRCRSQETTIQQLKHEVEKGEQIIKENSKVKDDVTYLNSEVTALRSQLEESARHVRSLEAEMAHLSTQCARINQCYKEKAESVLELRAQLEEAHARGAALCAEARAALAHVRRWAHATRRTHRKQEAQIKENESIICTLQRRIEEKNIDAPRNNSLENILRSRKQRFNERDGHSSAKSRHLCSNATSASENESTRSRYVSCSTSYTLVGEGQFCNLCGGDKRCPNCNRKEQRREMSVGTSESEMASCSSAPIPPKRLFRKKPACGDTRCSCRSSPPSRDKSVQLPIRRDASTACTPPPASPVRQRDASPVNGSRTSRDISPTEELMNRVERLTEALADGQRRWSRDRHARTT